MPDEPSTPPPIGPKRRAGTGLAGETTRDEGSANLSDWNLRPLEVIGDFEVYGKLGQGGMGAVYRARQRSVDREVALKILPTVFEDNADYVTRFQREARVAASLNHPNLVKVYASGQADGSHYIAMELIEGETLGQWIKRGPLPPLEALRITLDVARALECGWRTAHLIHRDIKPGNIFLSAKGEVKLGDLGLAKIVGADTTGLTHPGRALGTPHYISPEQARGDRELDFRADIYSLGCTLYQMLTKQTPYAGSEPMVVMNQHINAPPPAILKVMPQCPLPLARLVAKMLKKARRERPASYEELIAAIESVRWQLDPTLSPPGAPANTPSPTPLPTEPVELAGTKRRAAPDSDASLVTGGRRGATSRPPWPRPALYGGIGVLALAVAVFFLWPKEEKRTKAQLYAEEHASVGPVSPLATTGESIPAREDMLPPPVTATKDAPFVNTLGMKFVPAPILGGAVGGQRDLVPGHPSSGSPVPGAATSVLFSVWATRVQDYEVFVKETKHPWPKPPFEQGPTHPAVNVSWEDAQAFCAWLTARERKAGKLAASEGYRLPTDHEWSCAVGIGALEDPAEAPIEKQSKIDDTYPWGTQWPPPAGAGNYAGEELQTALSAGKYSYIKSVIQGYRDDFVETAPVGSFVANRYGLFDLGGNVFQWCEDWFDKEQKQRVMRGAPWDSYARHALLSSHRGANASGVRNNGYGFRCVLGFSAR